VALSEPYNNAKFVLPRNTQDLWLTFPFLIQLQHMLCNMNNEGLLVIISLPRILASKNFLQILNSQPTHITFARHGPFTIFLSLHLLACLVSMC
jgi:hypothetical protein